MCGIIGYTGSECAGNVILDGLEMLEYRGYDSAGLAIAGDCGIEVCKCTGRVANLRRKCSEHEIDGKTGIGHTRWATHGGVYDENAHPHSFGSVTVVHNGIIENYPELIRQYHLTGRLQSQTDSEVAAALLDHFYQGDPYAAISQTVDQLKGTYALGILFTEYPGVIFAVRNVSPIIAAMTPSGAMLASDITVLGQYAKEYLVIPELTVAKLEPEGISLLDLSGQPVMPQWRTVDWDIARVGKGSYPFFMEKEIMEQPQVIGKTLSGRIREGLPTFAADGVPDSLFTECRRVCIVACGTAMHAGLVAKALIQSQVKIYVEVVLASEFMYTDPVVEQNTLVIAVSQSGETIDTLEALKFARKNAARSLAIVNVKGSSIAEASEYVIYTDAGPEIAVASTKAYTTQLAIFYLITAKMGYVKGILSEERTRAFIKELCTVPRVMDRVLAEKEEIHHIAKKLLNAKDLFMIGRGMDYSILLEGSLKLKEISYIHSEAYASGELKHGTIALITEATPVIAVVTQEKLQRKEFSNIREVQSRGAGVTLFIKGSITVEDEQSYENIYRLPEMSDEFMAMPASLVLQLLAYYVSLDKGLDVDKPRNLAKVVTVE